MPLQFKADTAKELVFEHVAEYLHRQQLKFIKEDSSRPWGGFFVLDESETDRFIELYFPTLKKRGLTTPAKLSPKLLIVAPGKRLSWQYHHRRSELWKLIGGTAGIITSNNDTENDQRLIMPDETIHLEEGERHRLIGLDNWGIVAEIWQHSDASNPSDEEDIVRVQDDFGR
ncbi:MAG: hypothetical protein WCJ85_04965 [Chitinophagaceae bacterium]